ncbi:ATPase ASNA1 homolog [Octopus sinensis]|uniref:ATPase ASNA1 homolog n=1 Tax=Octopus sinensis TaxID=2607531 RepID=A0A7E6EJF3_9MOLL|nr:ATPase ASNA1 homolog [Octopus sinensis]
MEPGLENIIKQTSLRWIFVGGKGGVGKTTASCSLAIELSKVRTSVLLVSTDPAHNLSDAFDQKFSRHPIAVNGFENLFAMSRLVSDLTYSVVVFDTAPTGHTIRFLSLPGVLENNVSKLLRLKGVLSPILQQRILGVDSSSLATFFDKLSVYSDLISRLNAEFHDALKTTFVCVCIAEFLSVFETERLVTFLMDSEIDVRNIVVNQLLPSTGNKVGRECPRCSGRLELQREYLDKVVFLVCCQINVLYSDFHVTLVVQETTEVRGTDLLRISPDNSEIPRKIESLDSYVLKLDCPSVWNVVNLCCGGEDVGVTVISHFIDDDHIMGDIMLLIHKVFSKSDDIAHPLNVLWLYSLAINFDADFFILIELLVATSSIRKVIQKTKDTSFLLWPINVDVYQKYSQPQWETANKLIHDYISTRAIRMLKNNKLLNSPPRRSTPQSNHSADISVVQLAQIRSGHHPLIFETYRSFTPEDLFPCPGPPHLSPPIGIRDLCERPIFASRYLIAAYITN